MTITDDEIRGIIARLEERKTMLLVDIDDLPVANNWTDTRAVQLRRQAYQNKAEYLDQLIEFGRQALDLSDLNLAGD